MASIGWEKTGRRWRVFWHVTLQDGTIDKGSKSFLDLVVRGAFAPIGRREGEVVVEVRC